jgi:hypothetical protein
MAVFPEVSAPVFAMTGSATKAMRTLRTRLGTPSFGSGRSADSLPVFFTSDGLQVATASQAISDPEHWYLEAEPMAVFEGTENPRAFSIMQTYTQTEELPVADAAKVTVPLPSYKLGPGDEMFTNLADLNFNKFVTGRALPEYATLVTFTRQR